MTLFRDNQGFSLIEIILAMALFSVITVSLIGAQWDISVVSGSNKKIISAYNRTNTVLLNFLNGIPLPIESVVDQNQIIYSTIRWPFTKCESTIITRSVWKKGPNSTSTVEVALLNPELDEAAKIGMDCGGQPKKFESDHFHEIDSRDIGYPINSIDLFMSKVVVGLKSVSYDGPDVALVSLDNINLMTSLPIGGTGINKVDTLDGSYLGVQNSIEQQLVSLNIWDNNIDLIATSTLPQVTGQRPEGVSLYAYDSKVYIGTKRTAGHEFHVYDVSEQSALVWRGSVEVNHNINDIDVRDDLAFLATSGNVRDMIILNVSDPTHINQVAVVDLPGNEDGKSVYVSGNLIFLGRHKGLVSIHPELNVFEKISERSSISTKFIASAVVGGDINDIIFANNFVYIATNNPQKEIQIFRLDNRNNTLDLVWSINLPAPGISVDFEDNKFIFAAGSKLYIYAQE